MPLVDVRDLLGHATRHRYAVCAFDLPGMDFLSAVTAAAERTRAPVVLSVSESHLEHIDLELLAPAIEAAAHRSRLPIAIQFRCATSVASVVRAIRLGSNSVAIAPPPGSIGHDSDVLQAMAAIAHTCGVPVEAGCNAVVRSTDGGESCEAVTLEALRDFIGRIGADVLSIADLRMREPSRARFDVRRLEALRELGIPLAIDGNHRFVEAHMEKLIENGVAKIDSYVGLSSAAAEHLRRNVRANHRNGYLTLLEGVREAIQASAEQFLRLSGSAGRADDALDRCRPWRPVEHCILYNAIEGTSEQQVRAVMANGRRTLAAIPGVRQVMTGRALNPAAKYRYCWLVRFAHPAVVESYRRHPEHVAFADGEFRPLAPDRVSTDFEVIE